MPVPSPAAEVEIDPALVARLVAAQHPDLADRAVAPLAQGWDNALFTLGDDLVVRLPRRAAGVPLLVAEQRWLPELAPRLPLPTSTPLRVGVAAEGYPWPWSICHLLPGRSVLAHLDDGGRALESLPEDLGGFLRAMHVPAPPDAPTNPVRGGPLSDRDERTRSGLADLAATAELPDLGAGPEVAHALTQRWEDALALPGHPGPRVWLHGDVHPGNLLTDGDRLTGVVDFGDLCGGDPATDLGAAWMLFDEGGRARFRDTLAVDGRPVDDTTWSRARGWALSIGVALATTATDAPAYASLGRRTLAAVLADQD